MYDVSVVRQTTAEWSAPRVENSDSVHSFVCEAPLKIVRCVGRSSVPTRSNKSFPAIYGPENGISTLFDGYIRIVAMSSTPIAAKNTV